MVYITEAEFDTKTWQGYLKKKSLYAWHVAANQVNFFKLSLQNTHGQLMAS